MPGFAWPATGSPGSDIGELGAGSDDPRVGGLVAPVPAWQVLRPSAVASRFEALRGRALPQNWLFATAVRSGACDSPPLVVDAATPSTHRCLVSADYLLEAAALNW
jgi:hypothetical protein